MKNRIDLNSENQRQNGIKIGLYPIRELCLDAQNPRSHSPKQIRQIAQSIAVFGINVPILIDANKKVIAGHGRIMACELHHVSHDRPLAPRQAQRGRIATFCLYGLAAFG
jgi:hypothetical protein